MGAGQEPQNEAKRTCVLLAAVQRLSPGHAGMDDAGVPRLAAQTTRSNTTQRFSHDKCAMSQDGRQNHKLAPAHTCAVQASSASVHIPAESSSTVPATPCVALCENAHKIETATQSMHTITETSSSSDLRSNWIRSSHNERGSANSPA